MKKTGTKKKAAKREKGSPHPKATVKCTVEFNQDYVAETGPPIMGREGDVKTYPWSKQLAALCNDETDNGDTVLTLLDEIDSNSKEYAEKKAEAAKRETATA